MDCNMKRLTPIQVQEILQLYPDVPSSEIAQRYNQSLYNIYRTAQRYGVKKSAAFLSSEKSGRIRSGEKRSEATQFSKGHEPWTKGKKASEICRSKESMQRMHRWEKGHKPYNIKHDGAITIRTTSPGMKYKFIRLAENRWEFLHRYIYMQQYGMIPKGYNIVFKDGDQMNCNIENLECISDCELRQRNSILKYPLELQCAIKTKNKILRKLKEYGKKQNR